MKRIGILLALLVAILLAPSAWAGGAACKVIIDNGNGQAAAQDLIATLASIDKAILELEEYMTPEERTQALKLSYETCEVAERVDAFAAKLRKWYTAVAKIHANDQEYAAGAASKTTPESEP